MRCENQNKPADDRCEKISDQVGDFLAGALLVVLAAGVFMGFGIMGFTCAEFCYKKEQRDIFRVKSCERKIVKNPLREVDVLTLVSFSQPDKQLEVTNEDELTVEVDSLYIIGSKIKNMHDEYRYISYISEVTAPIESDNTIKLK